MWQLCLALTALPAFVRPAQYVAHQTREHPLSTHVVRQAVLVCREPAWLRDRLEERLWPAAAPALREIVSDRDSTLDEVHGVLWVLREAKGDRSGFAELTASFLSSPESRLRLSAARTIERIGTPRQGAVLIAALSDEEETVGYAAAKALAATGGRGELVAMTAWLRTTTARTDGHYRQHVTKCRDELERRLRITPVDE